MSETQIKLGNALLKSLVTLKEKKGGLNIEDVGALFEHMAESLSSTGSQIDTYVRGEIEKMAGYIAQAMNEISSIPLDPSKAEEVEHPMQNICLASDELDAVVKATEQATHDILNAADQIQDKLGKLDDKDSAKAIQDAVSIIYHACSFQDITGQRIAKVLAVLEFLQSKIANLKKLFDENADAFLPLKHAKDARPDAPLMRGPALDAPSQEQIDKLFANLK